MVGEVEPSSVATRQQQIAIAVAIGVTAPGILLAITPLHFSHTMEALFFGGAIVGAAFLLSWAAEVAQLDISRGLAIAALAFIAVLPEYAVDLVFAFKAGHAVAEYGMECRAAGDPSASPCSLALANMTGANRLLIGIGWSMVVFIAFFRSRQRPEGPIREVKLERSHSVEVAFLALATAYSLTLPLRGTLSLIDTMVLVGIFVVYTIRISKAPAEEPHLVGPARYIGGLDAPLRRAWAIGMFAFAALVILLVAEHFADALVATGREIGISEFLLVQWLAPLASEAPELLVAGLYAWRLDTNAGLGTLVSSKVNQWTLLVGTLPIAFSIASGGLGGLPVDAHQREELFLTAAQSAFAVATIATLSISLGEAGWLLFLFLAQFLLAAFVPAEYAGAERIAVGIGYLVLAARIFRREYGPMKEILRDGVSAPYSKLASAD